MIFSSSAWILDTAYSIAFKWKYKVHMLPKMLILTDTKSFVNWKLADLSRGCKYLDETLMSDVLCITPLVFLGVGLLGCTFELCIIQLEWITVWELLAMLFMLSEFVWLLWILDSTDVIDVSRADKLATTLEIEKVNEPILKRSDETDVAL